MVSLMLHCVYAASVRWTRRHHGPLAAVCSVKSVCMQQGLLRLICFELDGEEKDRSSEARFV